MFQVYSHNELLEPYWHLNDFNILFYFNKLHAVSFTHHLEYNGNDLPKAPT
jgi:hypothetical protein